MSQFQENKEGEEKNKQKYIVVQEFQKEFNQEFQNYKNALENCEQIHDENHFDVSDLQVFFGEQQLEKQIEEIEQNQNLKEITQKASKEEKQQAILSYQSHNCPRIIEKGKENVQEMKLESLDMQYALTQLKIPKYQSVETVQQLYSEQLQSHQIRKNIDEDNNNINNSNKFHILQKNYMKNPIPKILQQEQSLPSYNFQNQFLNEDDIILQVSIFRSVDGQKDNEVLMSGDQTLFQLSEGINCLVKDCCGEKDLREQTGSFFFIEDVFYNDTSGSNNKDLSKEIMISVARQMGSDTYNNNNNQGLMQNNFCQDDDEYDYEDDDEEDDYNVPYFQNNNSNNNKNQKKNQGIQNSDNSIYSIQNMQDTKLKDLKIVLGKPYVFRHMQYCDHMVVFTDLRFWGRDLPKQKKSYPLQIFLPKFKRHRCDCCQLYFAKVICFLDKISDKCITYFCEECYEDIHKDEEGNYKYKDYYIYPYIND